jgi:oxygen-independent coproporphyrinogen-3 oxidase
MAGVYISYPFCGQKCTFCNFASGVQPAAREAAYVARVQAELEAQAWAWRPETVYLGGGTPGNLATGVLARWLRAIPGREREEAPIEAAPGGLTREKLRAWRGAGINRVSFGVQSFDGRELRYTGRRHTAEVVRAEVALAREEGLGNFNIDLIAGLPYQTRGSWEASLDEVERLEAPHVSVYMLEVDEDSRLGRELLAGGARYGTTEAPGEEETVEFYLRAVERLAGMGVERYEISNFARAGFESKHNLKYWTGEPYVGFGADAHSFDGTWRSQTAETAAEYVARQEVRERTRANAVEERFFVGLRLMRGVELTEADRQRWGGEIARLQGDGLVEEHAGRLRLTGRGVLLSNEVFKEFLIDE